MVVVVEEVVAEDDEVGAADEAVEDAVPPPPPQDAAITTTSPNDAIRADPRITLPIRHEPVSSCRISMKFAPDLGEARPRLLA
jgi:hypothetical protein